MGFPSYDIDERDGRYFVLHYVHGVVVAEQGPFFTRHAAERRLDDLINSKPAQARKILRRRV